MKIYILVLAVFSMIVMALFSCETKQPEPKGYWEIIDKTLYESVIDTIGANVGIYGTAFNTEYYTAIVSNGDDIIKIRTGKDSVYSDSVYVRDSVVYYYGDTMKLQTMSHYFSVVYLDTIYGSDTIKLINHEEDN